MSGRNLRESLLAEAEAFHPDATGALNPVLRRGRRRRITRTSLAAAGGLALVALAAVSIQLIARSRETPPAGPGDDLRAPRVPADAAFRRSYLVSERWLIASGVSAGRRWATYAYAARPDARPCLADTGDFSGGGHCFNGFEPGRIDDRVSFGSTPPGNFDAVEGFTPPHVRRVRLEFVDGSGILEAPAFSADAFEVRFFVLPIEGGLRNRLYRITAYDSAGQVVLGGGTSGP